MTLPKARRVGDDDQITLTAATTYAPGDVVRMAPNIIGIVVGTKDIASGDSFTVQTEGKFELPMATGGTASLGAAAWWNSATSLVVAAAPTAGWYLGRFAKAKTSGPTVAVIDINKDPLPGTDTGAVLQVRRRCTIAEVNAGVTLLPAATGVKYRMINGAMIAIGGAAAAHTTIDLIGTQSASAVKLVAFAVAQTAENTLLQPGITGAAILAGGVSYVANDVNTAITVGKTGSSITTASHIDILMSYVREAG
jgi:predicted RecA/RadA family phage recombinase